VATRLHLVSDFNLDTLAGYLEHTALPGSTITTASYGQVYQMLAASPPVADATALVWTRPEAVIDGFRRALASEVIDEMLVGKEVQAYASAIARFAQSCRYVLVPTWTLPAWHRGYGVLDYRPGFGIAHLLARMNLMLSDTLADHPAVFVLDAQRWLAAVGPRAGSARLWYATKSPFSPALFEEAAADIAAAIAATSGASRRLVILDLDNVLWGGVVGETGWHEITLGGHDHVGEAFVDFQRALKALAARGIQLAIVSKNDEAVALEAIERHPEMQLRRSDFAAWRINWSDKAQNILDLLTDLHLGADSAVFLDDSAAERGRVRAAIAGVLVPDWPDDPTRYVEALASLRCFDTVAVTAEDRARTPMYTSERARKASLASADSLADWLASLEITVTISRLNAADLDRAAQLFNKTNQMNMATRRLSKLELRDWDSQPGHAIFTFRVSDRFGDSGLSAIVGLAIDGDRAVLVDFLLSCRVMGRFVEETMLHAAAAYSRAAGAGELVAEYRPTPRNGPCLSFLRRSGMATEDDSRFVWNTSRPYQCPGSVTLIDATAMAATDQ
jgi:FkbH-like protein